MPMFVLGRDYRLASKKGHIVIFKKGQPVNVVPEVIPEAVAIGAQCLDGEVDVLPPEVKEKIPMTAEEREQMILAAFEDIVAKNEREEFTGQGVPTVKAVEKATGIDTTTKEVAVIWKKYQASKAE